jgi:hypothetical protein
MKAPVTPVVRAAIGASHINRHLLVQKLLSGQPYALVTC